MNVRVAVISLCLAVSGCGVGTVDGQMPPPVTAASQTEPLTGEPFTPTLSGHRLALAGDVAIVLDPEGATEDGAQPKVYLASLSQHTLLKSIDLPIGANPQAVAVAADGYAYVLAAGLGGVYAVDVAHMKLSAFAQVCAAPSDLVSRGADVVVACRTGEVVTLSADGKHTLNLQPGLVRIAADANGSLFVATASAQIIALGNGASATPQQVTLPGTQRIQHANTPRRLLAMPGGGLMMLYQQTSDGELTDPFLEEGPPTPTNGGGDADAGFPTDPPPPTGEGGGSPYAGGGGCPVPATRPVFAVYDPQSGFGGQRWTVSTLAVDGALSPDGKTLAVADAANGSVRLESLTTMPTAGNDDTCFPMGSAVFEGDDIGNGPNSPTGITTSVTIDSPSSVVYSDTTLVVLSAMPSLALHTVLPGATGPAQTIVLRGRAVSDGFKLFHADPHGTASDADKNSNSFGFSSQSLACASCHPDGLSNGGTTTINGVVRRVMPLAGRLASSSIVHWEALSFHDAVAEGTWHQNMGGAELTVAQEQSLRAYIGQLKLPARPQATAAQLSTGSQAFAKAGCAGCHAPDTAFTNDSVADVGHGMHKVPSLVGLVYTAPYMSDGCAPTLEARLYDAACGGGEKHGNVQALTAGEQEALLAYLKTL
jgi:hypothetical protein